MRLGIGCVLEDKEIELLLEANGFDTSLDSFMKVASIIKDVLKINHENYKILKEIYDNDDKLRMIVIGKELNYNCSKNTQGERYIMYEIDSVSNSCCIEISEILNKLNMSIDNVHVGLINYE